METERSSEDQGNGRLKIQGPVLYIVLALAGWIVSGWVGYSSAASAMNARISVLESQKEDVQRRLSSIETKLDLVLARVR